jgi:hypothetical protein
VYAISSTAIVMQTALLGIVGLLASASSQAAFGETADSPLVRVAKENLAEEKAWLALMHYRHGWMGRAWTSEADAPAFFLAPDGKHDPHAELIADVQALLLDSVNGPSTRCRFPARYVWLSKRLAVPLDSTFPANCPELQSWLTTLPADSLSIDFAASYLENPSSMFGHTFLRFRSDGAPTLLSPTVNYAADSSRQVSKLDFVVKGLLGGFPGVADQLPYYRRLRTYSDNEGRDIWEYPLRLDRAQIELLRLHLWEIKDGTFDYYFLDENCSYRTLALIAAARPDLDLLDHFGFDVVPVETIKVLRDKELIDAGEFRPSSIRTLNWHTRNFSSKERRRLIAIASGRRPPGDLADIPREDRSKLLAAAMQYLAIRVNRDQVDVDTRASVMQALIAARLPLDAPPPDTPPATPPPDTGHGGHVLSAGWTDRHGVDGIEVGIAGFQHTLTDPVAGYAEGAAVTILGLRYLFEENGGNSLQSFDILQVESKTPSTRLFQQAAWTMQICIDRKPIAAQQPLVGTLSYATGRAIETGFGVLSLTLGLNLDGGAALNDKVAIEGAIKLDLVRQTALFGYRLFYEDARYLAGENSARHRAGVQVGVPLSRNLSIDAILQRSGALVTESEARIEIRQFF